MTKPTKLTSSYLSFLFQVQVPEVTSWSNPAAGSLSNVETEDSLPSCKCLSLKLLQEEQIVSSPWFSILFETTTKKQGTKK